MKINTKLAKESIMNRDGLNHLQIELIPPEKIKEDKSKPSLIIFAIDKSGSMDEIISSRPIESPVRPDMNSVNYSSLDGGTSLQPHLWLGRAQYNEQPRRGYRSKLNYAIDATTRFTELLTEKDLMGVVSFDNSADINLPLIHVNKNNLRDVLGNITSIRSGGCTNIADALDKAAQMITPDHLVNYNCKIILLSDGEANVGIRTADGLASLALKSLQKGITISSLGIGLSYDSAIMGAIAESGGGTMYHLENLSMLNEIFSNELKMSSSITAKDVRIYLEVPDLLEIGLNMNGYPQVIKGKDIEILIGDMFNPRKVVLELRNNFVESDIMFNVRVEYKDIEGIERNIKCQMPLKVIKTKEELEKGKEDKSVIDYALALIKETTVQQSSYNYQKGNIDELRSAFNQTDKILRSVSSTYSNNASCNLLSNDLKVMNCAYEDNSISASDAKAMYAQSIVSKRK